ncbi:unnamed protein product [Pedinophyceae sp. YPF-701]|nr:unnamed protein product [Pedinophyceae sp. YPF-701]
MSSPEVKPATGAAASSGPGNKTATDPRPAAMPRTVKLPVVSEYLPEQLHGTKWAMESFTVKKKLGQGNGTSVLLVETADAEQFPFALKVYRRSQLSNRAMRHLKREITIHSKLRHKNVLQFYCAFGDLHHIYIALQYAPKGDLFSQARMLKRQLPSEAKVVTKVLLPLLEACEHLHARNVVHRDIKPENILYGEDRELLLADFGLAIDASEERPVSRIGTLEFMPPEVLVAPDEEGPGFDASMDVWSLGVMAFELLHGRSPFHQRNKDASACKAAIVGQKIEYPAHFSFEAVHFLALCLNRDPAKRATVRQLLAHPLIGKHQPAAALPLMQSVEATWQQQGSGEQRADGSTASIAAYNQGDAGENATARTSPISRGAGGDGSSGAGDTHGREGYGARSQGNMHGWVARAPASMAGNCDKGGESRNSPPRANVEEQSHSVRAQPAAGASERLLWTDTGSRRQQPVPSARALGLPVPRDGGASLNGSRMQREPSARSLAQHAAMQRTMQSSTSRANLHSLLPSAQEGSVLPASSASNVLEPNFNAHTSSHTASSVGDSDYAPQWRHALDTAASQTELSDAPADAGASTHSTGHVPRGYRNGLPHPAGRAVAPSPLSSWSKSPSGNYGRGAGPGPSPLSGAPTSITTTTNQSSGASSGGSDKVATQPHDLHAQGGSPARRAGGAKWNEYGSMTVRADSMMDVVSPEQAGGAGGRLVAADSRGGEQQRGTGGSNSGRDSHSNPFVSRFSGMRQTDRADAADAVAHRVQAMAVREGTDN